MREKAKFMDITSTSLELAKPPTIATLLKETSYAEDPSYVPCQFALVFLLFIKLVNGGKGEENASPTVHLKMLDGIAQATGDVANLCFRGMGKSAIIEYTILFIAVYGEIPNFGVVNYCLYVSDSIDNGVKKMRLRLERRVENSEFLKEYLEDYKFTDQRWYFKNNAGHESVVNGSGVMTGVRGTVELNTRPQIAFLDDLFSDKDAKSPTVRKAINDVVYSAVDYALHPKRRKVIWSGTPFNASDPLYQAIESGAWHVNVFPICEKFPCTEEEFRPAWGDRFGYDYVKRQYDKSIATGNLSSFSQELMLQIMSDNERLITDGEILWFSRVALLTNRYNYNYYITTDFATSDKDSGDFSVISVWAVNAQGDFFWVDGICRKQLMDQNINDLFKLVKAYSPTSVGIEVSGQQGGFIPWIEAEMIRRNCFFEIAREAGSSTKGFRPKSGKLARFDTILHLFKTGKIKFPDELRDTPIMLELIDELSLATLGQFKSKHDDILDTISMLSMLEIWLPDEESEDVIEDENTDFQNMNKQWGSSEKASVKSSYIV